MFFFLFKVFLGLGNMESVPENAPEHCPGTQSELAGKASACEGCPNQGVCSSLPKLGPDPAIEEIRQKLSKVKHKVKNKYSQSHKYYN